MNAFERYIEERANGKEDTFDFPKNESSWEELFVFAKRLIDEIVSLRRKLAQLQAIKEAAQPFAELVDNIRIDDTDNDHMKLWINVGDVRKLAAALGEKS